MASVNKVILIGNLGRDPEVRYNNAGQAWATMSLATTRSWKNRETGERQEETEWHRVVLNDRLAEVAGEYLAKGLPVYIEGRLKTRKWQDKEGRDNYTTEILCESMQLLARREGRDEGRDEGGRPRGHQAQSSQRQAGDRSRSASQARAPARGESPGGFDSFDDSDIPF